MKNKSKLQLDCAKVWVKCYRALKALTYDNPYAMKFDHGKEFTSLKNKIDELPPRIVGQAKIELETKRSVMMIEPLQSGIVLKGERNINITMHTTANQKFISINNTDGEAIDFDAHRLDSVIHALQEIQKRARMLQANKCSFSRLVSNHPT